LIHSRHVSAAIVDLAESRFASLIYLATHGPHRFERLASGSIAAAVLHHATCPVIMFRPPELAARRVPERASAA
jgi:nucleotide-binding universal stress UspA family protein